MPIDYSEYHPDWKAISLRIREERAQNKCEWCGAPNHVWIMRSTKDAAQYQIAVGPDDHATGGYRRPIRVVLTVAHIDHDKTNNDDTNLAALCQRCHLKHDWQQHADNRRYGRNWKRDQTKLEL